LCSEGWGYKFSLFCLSSHITFKFVYWDLCCGFAHALVWIYIGSWRDMFIDWCGNVCTSLRLMPPPKHTCAIWLIFLKVSINTALLGVNLSLFFWPLNNCLHIGYLDRVGSGSVLLWYMAANLEVQKQVVIGFMIMCQGSAHARARTHTHTPTHSYIHSHTLIHTH
jgi:hypothetical protein